MYRRAKKYTIKLVLCNFLEGKRVLFMNYNNIILVQLFSPSRLTIDYTKVKLKVASTFYFYSHLHVLFEITQRKI